MCQKSKNTHTHTRTHFGARPERGASDHRDAASKYEASNPISVSKQQTLGSVYSRISIDSTNVEYDVRGTFESGSNNVRWLPWQYLK